MVHRNYRQESPLKHAPHINSNEDWSISWSIWSISLIYTRSCARVLTDGSKGLLCEVISGVHSNSHLQRFLSLFYVSGLDCCKPLVVKMCRVFFPLRTERANKKGRSLGVDRPLSFSPKLLTSASTSRLSRRNPHLPRQCPNHATQSPGQLLRTTVQTWCLLRLGRRQHQGTRHAATAALRPWAAPLPWPHTWRQHDAHGCEPQAFFLTWAYTCLSLEREGGGRGVCVGVCGSGLVAYACMSVCKKGSGTETGRNGSKGSERRKGARGRAGPGWEVWPSLIVCHLSVCPSLHSLCHPSQTHKTPHIQTSSL